MRSIIVLASTIILSCVPALLLAACPEGQVELGAGQCCWPGQRADAGACKGMPTSCPEGFALDDAAQSCVLLPCLVQQERVDEVHCCWPGQRFEGGACVGEPSCREGWRADAQSCVVSEGGLLSVEGSPLGAQVEIMSAQGPVGRGTLPLSGLSLPAGIYTIEVSGYQFEAQKLVTELEAASSQALSVSLWDAQLLKQLLSTGLAREQLDKLAAQGIHFDEQALNTVQELAQRGFPPEEVVAAAETQGLFQRPSRDAVGLMVLQRAGMSDAQAQELLASSGSWTEAYNQAQESSALDIAVYSVSILGSLGVAVGLPWALSDASDAAWATLGTGAGLTVTALALGLIDGMDVGALPDGFLEGADVEQLRERFGSGSQAQWLATPYVDAHGAGMGLVVLF